MDKQFCQYVYNNISLRGIKTAHFTGHFQVKIGHASPKSHLSMTFCTMQHGTSVHLWTAVATRKTHITQIELLQLSAELLSQGFSMQDSMLIMWTECPSVSTLIFPY